MIRARHIIYSCLLLLLSCSSDKDLRDQSILESISKIDSNLFHQRLKTYSSKTSNTNYILWGEFINAPDSIYTFVSGKSTAYQILTLLSQKNLDGLFKWLKLVDDHGLDSNFYHASKIHEFFNWAKVTSINGRPLNLDTLAVFSILCADAAYSSVHDICLGRSSPKYSGTANTLIRRKLNWGFAKIITNNGVDDNRKWIPRSKEYRAIQERYKLFKSIPKHVFKIDSSAIAYTTDSLALIDLYARLCLINGTYFSDTFLHHPNLRVLYKLMVNINSQIDSSSEGWNQRIKDLINFKPTEIGQKLALNLDRWRWMDPVSKGSYVWVNIARNELDAYRNDTLVLTMKVCTGKGRNSRYFRSILSYLRKDSGSFRPQNHETPCLKSSITYFVVLPTWKVPKSILFNELIGKIRRNPGYIYRLGYKLKTYSGKQVDPYSVKWDEITPNNIKYYLEEPSGPKNSLGSLKAIFSNPYSVYCHDTPNKWAFSYANRHVSHGCVRLNSPYDFIGYLMSVQDENSMDYVDMALGNAPSRDTSLIRLHLEEQKDTNIRVKNFGKKSNLKFQLKKNIPIHLVYLTIEIDQKGILRTFNDGYGRDKMLTASFRNPSIVHYEVMP